MVKPRADKTLAHRGFCLVDYPEQRTALCFREHSLSQLEVALGVVVKAHVLRFVVDLKVVDALKTAHLCFAQVIDQRADRAYHNGLVRYQVHFVGKLLFYCFSAKRKLEFIVVKHFDFGGQLALDKLRQLLEVYNIAAEKYLARTVGRQLIGQYPVVIPA